MTLPTAWTDRLRVPVLAAPMTDVSTAGLVVAAARAGVAAALPTHNVPAPELAGVFHAITATLADADGPAPWGINLIVHRSNRRRDHDVARVAEASVPFAIASVGSPAPIVDVLHAAGTLVFSDVASMRHVDRALAAGVDGLVALCAGAGGQTGALNPFAFIRAIRQIYDGPVALAGGIADGVALAAAIISGADVGYIGTRFIATHESGADDDYRTALVDAGPDDVVVDHSMTGLAANVLRGSEGQNQPAAFDQEALLAHRGAWSAGHGVASIRRVQSCAEVVADLRAEYEDARERL